MNELDFSGRVAVVTGAGNGLGRAYALWLAARGAMVVVNNRRHANRAWSAAAVVQEIEARGGIAIADAGDASMAGSGAAMVENALQAFGRIDILILNAASNHKRAIAEQSFDQLRENMEINFFGAIQSVLAAMPFFTAQDYGRIVFTTSAAALFGQAHHTAYASAKMAQVGFARALAVETGRTGIRINTVSPYALTNMSRHAIPDRLQHLMAPDHVAPVVGWLAHESCDVTGQVFSVGAGRVRRTALVEGPVIELADTPAAVWTKRLADLATMTEPRNSGRSALALVPELNEDTSP